MKNYDRIFYPKPIPTEAEHGAGQAREIDLTQWGCTILGTATSVARDKLGHKALLDDIRSLGIGVCILKVGRQHKVHTIEIHMLTWVEVFQHSPACWDDVLSYAVDVMDSLI